MFFAASTTCSKGLFPRWVADAEAFAAFSPSKSGTERFFEVGLLERGGREGGRGGAKRRRYVVWVSFSYSTEVLRGRFRRVVPEAHALLGLEAGIMLLVAAR